MKQLTEVGLNEEAVRPFARMAARLVTADELQKLGVDASEESNHTFITLCGTACIEGGH